MEYKIVNNAKDIVNNSPFVVNNPTNYKNKWHDLFHNHNAIWNLVLVVVKC